MLDPQRRARVEAEAKRRGVNPAAAVAEAERIDAAKPAEAPAPEAAPVKDAATARPVADRLLIGFLPFIKVHELRTLWLNLPERIADDELTCSEFAIKHGGPVAPTTADPVTEPAP